MLPTQRPGGFCLENARFCTCSRQASIARKRGCQRASASSSYHRPAQEKPTALLDSGSTARTRPTHQELAQARYSLTLVYPKACSRLTLSQVDCSDCAIHTTGWHSAHCRCPAFSHRKVTVTEYNCYPLMDMQHRLEAGRCKAVFLPRALRKP